MDSLSEGLDVLSLSPHSDWHDSTNTSSGATDLETADWIVVDEVGLIGSPQRAEGRRNTPSPPRALGPVGESPGMFSSSDDSPQDNRQVVVSRNRLRQCPVCGESTREKIRRHVFKKHLPWFWSGTTACWDCHKQETQASSLALRHSADHRVGCFFDEDHLHQWCQLINGSLHQLRKWFDCRDLEDLLQYVIGRTLYVDVKSGFSEQEHQLLLSYVESYSPDGLSHITANPPNHPVSLTNWEIMATLLRRLGPNQQKSLAEHEEYLTYEGNPITEPVISPSEPFIFVDSHFHLDLVLKRLHFRNFMHMSSELAPPDNNNSFYYGIANYVFTNNWDSWAVQVGAAKQVYVSFGIHPHEAAKGVTKKQLADLEYLAGNERCVAIGEIGLDYTTRCDCKPRCRTPTECQNAMRDCQERAFVSMLLVADRQQLPVIIHCRDNGSGEAAARALDIIKASFNHLQFHRHCFDGSLTELQEWQTLPHVVFGITGKFMKAPNRDSHTVISRILPHQLVLETDAPFLAPTSRNEVNHPWNLLKVAVEVSKIRNVPLKVLTWLTNDNALQFYCPGKRQLKQPSLDLDPRPRQVHL